MSEHLISEEFKEKLKEVNNNFIEKYGAYLPKDDYATKKYLNKYDFRGKRRSDGRWIGGGYCCCSDTCYIVTGARYLPHSYENYERFEYYAEHPVYEPIFDEVYPITIGQYTGVHDKHGIKIYEGDIVQYSTYDDFDCQSVVKFGEYKQDDSAGEYGTRKCLGFYVEVNNFTCPDWCENEPECFDDWKKQQNILEVANECEVIGNIYDNPELLK